MTLEDAENTRNAWIETFTEMREHMNPMKAKNTKVAFNAYGMERKASDDEEEEDEGSGHEYMAILPCGQVRNHCSYNASCNAQFQGTVSVGAKLAGWNLVYHGYGDRLLDFVHDEFLYWLWPNELQTHIPIIEKLMVDGMRTVIVSTKVGVETSCMLWWNKKATVFQDLQYMDDGTPILEPPPFVKSLHDARTAQKG